MTMQHCFVHFDGQDSGTLSVRQELTVLSVLACVVMGSGCKQLPAYTVL